ncbi:hypothetical protein CYLTODRAFT_442203 [Cylindrobasidium torrendii FP15055 ss-10]|uniref:TEA domain-containing protein n=1 Tax=Cylindrobasidium torrendii FP15055 ss-10 TaxID=1314674 RepID=A0A0D7BKD6_9AGAR|nr:hypothetical protein CYLTODRAFT_442203 [Cylindrobasidium torrendii FP15055 ss-10]
MVYNHSDPPNPYPSHHDDLYPPCAIDTIALPSRTTVERDAPAIGFDITMTGRKIWKLTKAKSEESKAERVWPLEIETKLIEALERYKVPNQLPRRTRFQRFPRRNRFISDYIFNTTGSVRTAKQVGSRLQQLRDSCKDPRITRLITDVEFSMNTSSSAPYVYIGQPSAEMNLSSPDSDSPKSPFIETAQPLPTRKQDFQTSKHLSIPTTHSLATKADELSWDSTEQNYHPPAQETLAQHWSSSTVPCSQIHNPSLSTCSGLLSFDDTDDSSPQDSEPSSSYSATSSSHSLVPSLSFYGEGPFDIDPTQNFHSPPFLEPLTLPSALHFEDSAATSYAPPHLPSGGYISVKQEAVEPSNWTAASSVGTYNVNTSSTSLSDALGCQYPCTSQHDARAPPVLDSHSSPAYNHTIQYHA